MRQKPGLEAWKILPRPCLDIYFGHGIFSARVYCLRYGLDVLDSAAAQPCSFHLASARAIEASKLNTVHADYNLSIRLIK